MDQSMPEYSEHPHKRLKLSATADDNTALPNHMNSTTSPTLLNSGQKITANKTAQSSSFRNVSACNRCRLRKNKCDQQLPSCASCDKANVKCVGYDPITKKEIPRSYVFYLETRVEYLQSLLQSAGVAYIPAESLEAPAQLTPTTATFQTPTEASPRGSHVLPRTQSIQSSEHHTHNAQHKESQHLDALVSDIEHASVKGMSDTRYLASTSGISFARVVLAAVKSSVPESKSDKEGSRVNEAVNVGPTMRDSFFGLHTKPTIKQASFPEKALGLHLATIFFEYSNCQIPILHRSEFMSMFEDVYSNPGRSRTPRESYLLNIVYAIGSGIFVSSSSDETSNTADHEITSRSNSALPEHTMKSSSNQQCQPEEYHASAIVHLEACLSSSGSDKSEVSSGGLEELQLVLLLAGFALLRPVAPGLWYIVGVAVRLAIDLGLHYEDGKDIDSGPEKHDINNQDINNQIAESKDDDAARERGRRLWIRDMRRRLWWCTYAFDRLVSSCTGRPFGITDQVITTDFPSVFDDEYIKREGFLQPPGGLEGPSYKRIAHHYFRLRLLQSEILQVLQYQQAQLVRANATSPRNPYMHSQLPSPFLVQFKSFRLWRIDVDRRLWEWKESAPTKKDAGVEFKPEFFELNYWQSVIMLYRQSLSVPSVFKGEHNISADIESHSTHMFEHKDDEQRVFLKVAEAGQRTLRLYRSLHRLKLVNYTYLATHHLFMSGIAFLYAIWHSPIVRSRLTMDEVDFTILAATSVLGDLIERCPPAEACRDAFDRMSKATVQMCMATTGFSSSAGYGSVTNPQRSFNARQASDQPMTHRQPVPAFVPRTDDVSRPISKQIPRFDIGLNDLFPTPSPPPQPDTEQVQKLAQNMWPVNAESSSARVQHASRQPLVSPDGYPLSNFNDISSIDPSLRMPMTEYPFRGSQLLNEVGLDDVDFSTMDFLNADMSNAGVGNDQAGLGSGFGLGWEALGNNHDFSEGGQLDLFDGFFFGGGSG